MYRYIDKPLQLLKFIYTKMPRRWHFGTNKFQVSGWFIFKKAERKVENEAEELRELWDLRMRILTERESKVGILGTSPSYIEYSKMFYDGEKIGEVRNSGHYNFVGGEIWEKR